MSDSEPTNAAERADGLGDAPAALGVVAVGLAFVGALVGSGWLLEVVTRPGRPLESASWIGVAAIWVVFGIGAVFAFRWWSRTEAHSPSTNGPTRNAAQPDSSAPTRDDLANMHRPWMIKLVAEAGLVIVVIVLLVGQSLAAWTESWIGSIDTKYYGWLAWRLAHDGPSLRLDGVVHPGGLDVLLLDGLGPISLSGIGVRLFGRWLGYNMVVAGGMVANYLGARYLARTLGGDRFVAIACGLAYVSAPLFVGPVGSFPSLLWAFTPPLLLAETIQIARGDVTLRLGRVAGLLVAAYLCSIYHLVFGAIAAAVVGLLWPNSALRRRDELKRGAVALVAALVVLSPFIVARFNYIGEERDAGASASRQIADAATFSADVLDPFALPPDSRVVGDSARLGLGERPLERYRTGAVGWAVLGGALLGMMRRHAGRPALVAGALTLWLLSLGPVLTFAGSRFGPDPVGGDWLPYRAVLAVPGLSALRAPYRVTMVLAAVLVALMSVGLARLRDRRSRLIAGVVLVALGVVSWWPQTATSRVEIPAALVDALPTMERADPGKLGAVMVVPFTCGFDDLDVMNWQPSHDRPMVVCGVSQSATRWFTRLGTWFDTEGFAATFCTPETTVLGEASGFDPATVLTEGGIDELRDRMDVRWLAFDRGRANGCRTAAATMEAISLLPVVADDGRFIIVDLGDRP